MKTTEAQLNAIKRWRSNNREKYNDKYYYENKEKILEKKKLYYLKKKLAKEELKENITNENQEFIEAEIID
jgi:hypothetical protein